MWETNSESDGTSNGKGDGTNIGENHYVLCKKNGNVVVMAVVVVAGVEGSGADEYTK